MDGFFVFPALHILDPMTTTIAQKLRAAFILLRIIEQSSVFFHSL